MQCGHRGHGPLCRSGDFALPWGLLHLRHLQIVFGGEESNTTEWGIGSGLGVTVVVAGVSSMRLAQVALVVAVGLVLHRIVFV